jgi:hypothetical protein
MRATEFLAESLSRVAYHYTNLHSAAKIMASGKFELSSDLGSVEQQYAPKGHRYFLSTTRTLTGGYHEYTSSGSAMFVLDGNWFNQHYKSGPVDYWGNRDPLQSHHKAHEAEDRVFSKTSTIPINGVTAVHVLIKPDSENEHLGALARTVFINAKKRDIKAYLYDDEVAWRALDTRRSLPLSKNPMLRGPQALGSRSSMYKPKGYLHPWIQLLTARDKSQLGKDANSIRSSLSREYDAVFALQGLGVEMSNARKPSAGIDRENATRIITYMGQHKLNNLEDLVDHLKQKWAPKQKQDEQ